MQLMQIQGLRATERDQRSQIETLREDSDRVVQEKMQAEAEISALRDELREKTTRLVDAWTAGSSTPTGGRSSSLAGQDGLQSELDHERRQCEKLRQLLAEQEERERQNSSTIRANVERLEEELNSEIQRNAHQCETLRND